MYTANQLLTLLSLITIFSSVFGKDCVSNGPCMCTFDDGSGVVDITSLASKTGPAFKDQASEDPEDLYVYSYNPCISFSQGSCSGASVCQNSFDTEYYILGDQQSAIWSMDGQDLQVYYNKFTDVLRETFVTYKCDMNAKNPSFSVQGEKEPARFYMTVTTECACPNVCATDINVVVEVGISTGTLLCILFLVAIVVYLGSGVAYNRYRKEATGVEMLPNRTFWASLPGLIKDGFAFTVQKVRGGGANRSTYEQV